MKITFNRRHIERHYPAEKKNWQAGEAAEVLDDWAKLFIDGGIAVEGGKPKGTKVKKATERDDA